MTQSGTRNNLAIPADLKPEMEKLAGQYEKRSTAMLPILYLVQKKLGYIPAPVEPMVAEVMGVSLSRVREILTFYKHFHRQPVGRIHVQLCRNVSCSLNNAEALAQALKNKYGLDNGGITPDGLISLERVECLAACDIAPAARLNDQYVGPLTAEKLIGLLEGMKKNV